MTSVNQTCTEFRYPADGTWTWPFTEDHPSDDIIVQTKNGYIVAAGITIHHNWLSQEVLGWKTGQS